MWATLTISLLTVNTVWVVVWAVVLAVKYNVLIPFHRLWAILFVENMLIEVVITLITTNPQ